MTLYALSRSMREEFMLAALDCAQAAGLIQMDFYNRSSIDQSCLDIVIKPDEIPSPATAADYAVQDYITGFIKELDPDIAIISEENIQHPAIPENGLFWCIDPLDGTKEFLARTDAFTVNIALMDKFEPVLGIVHNPALKTTFFSHLNHPAWKRGPDGKVQEIVTRKADPCLTTLFNSMHGNPAVYASVRDLMRGSGIDLPETPIGKPALPRGLRVAEGSADLFVDCGHKMSFKGGNGYSWDYAPILMILENAGGLTFQIADGKRPSFRNPTQKMNAMMSFGDKELGKKAALWCENRCQ